MLPRASAVSSFEAVVRNLCTVFALEPPAPWQADVLVDVILSIPGLDAAVRNEALKCLEQLQPFFKSLCAPAAAVVLALFGWECGQQASPARACSYPFAFLTFVFVMPATVGLHASPALPLVRRLL